MRARMGLAYSLTSYEHREILLKDRPQSLYDISPKGTVPVLQLEDGTVLEESIDIMRWALTQNDPDSWYEDKIDEQDKLIHGNDQDFKRRLDKYKYHVRFPENDLEFHQKGVAEFLLRYDDKLRSETFLFGSQITLADVALMPFIRQCAHVDLDWFNTQFPFLAKWLMSLKESKLFNSIMTKHAIWDEASKGIIVKWD